MIDSDSVLVVGGGVIGLSLAWELVKRGRQVALVDKGKLGRKASWAGAGILAPANAKTATQPMDKLMGLGSDLHRQWAEDLFEATGIDNGYRECGGIYVAETKGDKAALTGQMLNWSEYEIEFEHVDRSNHWQADFLGVGGEAMILNVPGESQICNPDHLDALADGCRQNGVKIYEQCGEPRLNLSNGRVDAVSIGGDRFEFDQVCICVGAWSKEWLSQFGVQLPLIPVRGQMLMFKLEEPVFSSIINVGTRYIVPRETGHVLVGSTLEEVGFDERTTDEKLLELQQFAISMVPVLTSDKCVASWAGLRPATHDGFPFMGRLASLENCLVATGHFKCGLQMSPAVAVCMADLLEGKDTIMDVSPFDPSRLDFLGELNAFQRSASSA